MKRSMTAMAGLVVVACVLLIGAGMASATTATLYATDHDASILSKRQANINYGNETNLSVYTASFSDQKALLKFDLSGIPSGATINSATLTLYSDVTYQVNAGVGANPHHIPMDVFRVTNPWQESTVTWNTIGGGYVGTTGLPDQYNANAPAWSALYQYARATDNPTANDVPVSWTVTSLVDQWYQGTYANNGLLIRSYYILGYYDSVDANHLIFRSSEYAGTALDPTLIVNYTVPEPATLSLLAIGGLALIRRRRKA